MNRWKVIAGILLIFILGAFCGVIGSGVLLKHRIKRFMDPAGPPPPIRVLQRQLDAFELSEDQRVRVDALVDAMHREFTDFFRKTQPQFKAVFDRHVSQIRAVLDPVQQKQLDEAVNRIETRMKQPPFGRKGPRPGPDPERLFRRLQQQLNLSDDQLAQIRPILDEEMEKRHGMLSDAEGSHDRRARREQMMQLHQATEKRLQAILTPEQLEAFRTLRRERRP
jgi:hypothetical protein